MLKVKTIKFTQKEIHSILKQICTVGYTIQFREEKDKMSPLNPFMNCKLSFSLLKKKYEIEFNKVKFQSVFPFFCMRCQFSMLRFL